MTANGGGSGFMNGAAYWDGVFTKKAASEVSWYRPHLDLSLELIQRCAAPSAAIIDVGAGESTLVDDLLTRGYTNLTMLDISQAAIEATRNRLCASGDAVRWMVGDVTSVSLPRLAFDLWHDRAVFHFLVDPEIRQKYVRNVVDAVRPGGYVIVSTFGPEGPTKCSGLDVMRYDVESLHREFGRRFRIEESTQELHRTPWGTSQQFVYCCCKLE
jgi:SAM-dependent methyltransferase